MKTKRRKPSKDNPFNKVPFAVKKEQGAVHDGWYTKRVHRPEQVDKYLNGVKV